MTTPSHLTEHARTGAKSRDQRLLNASWLGDAVTVRQCLVSVLHHLVGIGTVQGGGCQYSPWRGVSVQSMEGGVSTVHGGGCQYSPWRWVSVQSREGGVSTVQGGGCQYSPGRWVSVQSREGGVSTVWRGGCWYRPCVVDVCCGGTSWSYYMLL